MNELGFQSFEAVRHNPFCKSTKSSLPRRESNISFWQAPFHRNCLVQGNSFRIVSMERERSICTNASENVSRDTVFGSHSLNPPQQWIMHHHNPP
eukprot:Gb_04481 [translate_table: standard]